MTDLYSSETLMQLFDIDAMTDEPRTCRKCGGPMRPGIAMDQTYTAGAPDSGPDDTVQTLSPGGPGAIIPASKCADCGWSVTK